MPPPTWLGVRVRVRVRIRVRVWVRVGVRVGVRMPPPTVRGTKQVRLASCSTW